MSTFLLMGCAGLTNSNNSEKQAPATNGTENQVPDNEEKPFQPDVVVDTDVPITLPGLISVETASSTIVQITVDEPIKPESAVIDNITSSAGVSINSVDISTSDPKILQITMSEPMLPRMTELNLSSFKTESRNYGNIQIKFVPETRAIFVTNARGRGNITQWSIPTTQTGLAAADDICQKEAKAYKLEGIFVAWLSSSTKDARDSLANSSGGFLSTGPGHPVFALTQTDFLESKTLTSLSYDASGTSVNTYGELALMTHTKYDGTRASTVAAESCNDWTSSASARTLMYGSTTMVGRAWTDKAKDGDCNSEMRLVCVQTGNGINFTKAKDIGQQIFVTSTTGTGNFGTWGNNEPTDTGIVGADKICVKRATAANLNNAIRFKAWVSSQMFSAKDRFTIQKNAYVNTLGMKVAIDMSALSLGLLTNGIAYDEFGNSKNNYTPVFTGTTVGGVKNGEQHCQDWSSEAPNVAVTKGMIGSMGPGWTNQYPNGVGCDQKSALVCIED